MARKKKESPNPGLTPPNLLAQIKAEVCDEVVPKVQSKSEAKRRSVLQSSRLAKAKGAGDSGVFSTPKLPDNGREASPKQTAVPDESRQSLDTDIALSDMVRTIMLEPINTPIPEGCSHMESMVRKVCLRASQGDQQAISWVGDRIEGKPGQAPKKSTSIEDVEQQIDQVEVAALNRLTEDNNG